MSMNKKIQDKSMNLDVKGQGCWDDCYISSGHWENKVTKSNCSWVPPYFNWVTNMFL